MADVHSFNVDIAVEYGVNAAIILRHIAFWIEKNAANEKHFHDGRYWTYNSRKAFLEMFPYMTEWQVRTALQKLIDSGLISVGNYNAIDYDRTKWYSLTEKGQELIDGKKTTNPLVNFTNGDGENHQPIPDSNTDIKTDISTSAQKKTEMEAAFEEFWQAYPKKEAKKDAIKAFSKLKASEYPLLIPAIKRQAVEKQWTKDKKRFIPNPATWLNGRRWEDETEMVTLDEHATKAADWLSRKISERMPDRKKPTETEIAAWARDINAIHDVDGYEWDLIGDIAYFSQTDAFWRTNILSGYDLRKNFEKLMSHEQRNYN